MEPSAPSDTSGAPSAVHTPSACPHRPDARWRPARRRRHGAAVDLATVLRRQDGVISRSQALACGLSESRIRRLVDAGTWWTVFPGVHTATDRSFTPAARVWAVVLWAGAGATLAGVTAGWWWGLIADLPAVLTVVVPPARRPRPPDGVRLLRRAIDPRDRVHRRGLPVVALPLAVLETAVELGGERGPQVLDRSLQRRVSLEDLRRARSRVVGARGAAEMGRLITVAGDRAASALERLLARLLLDAGILGWEVNGRVVLPDRHVDVDILFRDARVAIELKGWAFHSDPESVDADQDRENVLQIAGFIVLQISWWDVTIRPCQTIARIRQALVARGEKV